MLNPAEIAIERRQAVNTRALDDVLAGVMSLLGMSDSLDEVQDR